MKGKKKIFARVLHASGIFNMLRSPDCLIVFTYHRMYAHGQSADVAFDSGVYNTEEKEFIRHVRWLKRNTNIISVQDLPEVLNKREPAGKATVILTFDDGYIDNYTVAYPVLHQMELPAVFFIPTEIIESRRLGWWDMISFLIKQCILEKLSWEDRMFSLPLERSGAISYFHSMMAEMPSDETGHLIERLAEACEVQVPDEMFQNRELMTWDHIREMSSKNMTIGSHCTTHRVLATLSDADQHEEMRTSREVLENRIDKKVAAISYPVGDIHNITASTPAIARSCGYELGFTANSGINHWDGIDPLLIRRARGFGGREHVSSVAASSVLPQIFQNY